MASQLFFMYGTLRQGYAPNQRLMPNSRFVGLGVAKGERMGLSYFKPSKEYGLTGEVWSVPNEEIPGLDRYEGHPHAWHRKKVTVLMLANRTPVRAWLYFSPNLRRTE